MNLISKFPTILEESRKLYQGSRLKRDVKDFEITEEINCTKDDERNILALGDNCRFMETLLTENDMEGKIKLIYIDPPFFSKASYDATINIYGKNGEKLPSVKYFAYNDVWQNDMAVYLSMLCHRLYLMRDLLAEDGTIWVHLDWHSVHYIKVFMDEIFGEENFINEIVWQYKSGGSGKRHFARKHDTILVYGKTKKYYLKLPQEKSYNRGFKPYRFKGVKEYRDDMGWYTMVTMKDVWQIDMVGRTSSERTGYATQKPEGLLQRIIESSTKEGDICADFFCGSGTLAAVAQKMGRRWVCCDGSSLAVNSTLKRLMPENIQLLQDCHLSCNNTEEGNTIQASLNIEELSGTDKDVITISIDGYKLPFDSYKRCMIGEKERKTIEILEKENSLSLIESWSVDFDCDGEVYRPQLFFYREKGHIVTEGKKFIPKGVRRKIRIKAVDLLGNSTYKNFTNI